MERFFPRRPMPAPVIYLAITNHGFGHATRAASIAATVKALAPEVELIFATTAPRWLLAEYLPWEFEYRPVAFDMGVIQPDSLTLDRPATLAQLRQIQATQEQRLAAEVPFLQERRVRLVLADIPPLATALARAAGVPCWMVGNFGWDFIYRALGEEFAEVADWVGGCFAHCDRLFRLPFHEPMAAFPVLQEVGLTGGTPRYDADQLRRRWQLETPQEQTILLTFGGLGLHTIPYDRLAAWPDWQFLTFDEAIPDLPNLRTIPRQGFRPVDVMPLCSRVVCKPGFSTFAEACRLDLPIITLTREDFAEGPVLVAGMQDHSWHQVIDPEDFFRGDWSFLAQPLQPPRTDQPVDKQGNEQVARAILAYLQP